MKIPDDLQAAIDAEPKAKEMLAKLSAQNRFALAFRVHNMKTEAGRKKKIETFVEMLKRGETIYPQAQEMSLRTALHNSCAAHRALRIYFSHFLLVGSANPVVSQKWGYFRIAHIYVSPSQEKSTEFLGAHRRARNWSDQDLPLRNSASRPMIPASSRTTHPFAV